MALCGERRTLKNSGAAERNGDSGSSKTVWTPEAQAIFRILADQPVAYRGNLALAFEGDAITALVMSQSFYFDSEAHARGMSWWSKTDAEFAKRLGVHVKRFRRSMDILTDEGMSLLRHRSRRYQCTEYQVDWNRSFAYIAGKAHLWMPAQTELPLPEMGSGPLPVLGNGHYPKRVMVTTQNGQSKEIKEIKEESVGGAPRVHPAILAFFEASGERFWPQAGLIPIIIAKVGDDPERVALWKQINIARLSRGEMLMNIDKSLAWLEAGKVPDGTKVSKPQRGKTMRRPQVEYTEKQRAAAESKAAEYLSRQSAQGAQEILEERLKRYRDGLKSATTQQQRSYFETAIQQLEQQQMQKIAQEQNSAVDG